MVETVTGDHISRSKSEGYMLGGEEAGILKVRKLVVELTLSSSGRAHEENVKNFRDLNDSKLIFNA